MFDDQRMILSLELLSSNDNRSARLLYLFSQWAWTRRCNVPVAASCRRHWLGATTVIIGKNSYCLCSDFPRPGWLAGMSGRTPPVHLPGRYGRGAATVQRSSYCRRHWLGATTVWIAIKFLFLLFRSPRAWMADQNGWTFIDGLFSQWTWTRRSNIAAGHFLPQTLAWRYNNKNSTKNSHCLCSDLPGPGRLTRMSRCSPAVNFSHEHEWGAAT